MANIATMALLGVSSAANLAAESFSNLAEAVSKPTYKFRPVTSQNIGRNHLKRYYSSKKYLGATSKHEIAKRLTRGDVLPKVKITPRRSNDFTGKSFERLAGA